MATGYWDVLVRYRLCRDLYRRAFHTPPIPAPVPKTRLTCQFPFAKLDASPAKLDALLAKLDALPLPRRVIRSPHTTDFTTGLGKARGSLDDRHNASTNASSSAFPSCTVHHAGPCSARASKACHPCRSSSSTPAPHHVLLLSADEKTPSVQPKRSSTPCNSERSACTRRAA